MSRLSRHLAKILIVLVFSGWIGYPGWWNNWYSDFPEHYAWPASLYNPMDPKWGFWYW